MKTRILRRVLFLTICLGSVFWIACGQPDQDETNEPLYTPSEEIEVVVPEVEEKEPPYSLASLIIMVEEGTTEEQVQELCNDYNLEVMYKYDIMSGYALETKDNLDKQQFDSLIDSIESYSFVIAVEKDYIAHLDDVED